MKEALLITSIHLEGQS